uniref:Nudix hydrolase domain-containing protein n=1 Tax=Nelumbo nucifera TaxID=4432 RepID=A0A822Y9R4_NELNU|nr:TPA_asm: hypothetical protein HUJ06_029467 [Nelumbo nucifera]
MDYYFRYAIHIEYFVWKHNHAPKFPPTVKLSSIQNKAFCLLYSFSSCSYKKCDMGFGAIFLHLCIWDFIPSLGAFFISSFWLCLYAGYYLFSDKSLRPSGPANSMIVFLNYIVFNSCAALRPYIAHIDDIYKDFTSYKVRVPVTGAIILDESYERCLLVKGWKAGSSWSFPRGKKNKDEEDHTCAIREVLEETGFDISKLLKMEDYLEVTIGQQRVRLYIIPGVKEDTVFAPMTKKEISEISWHRIDEFQPAGNEVISRGSNGLKLYMVAPFLASLKAWIAANQPPTAQKSEASFKGFFYPSLK